MYKVFQKHICQQLARKIVDKQTMFDLLHRQERLVNQVMPKTHFAVITLSSFCLCKYSGSWNWIQQIYMSVKNVFKKCPLSLAECFLK